MNNKRQTIWLVSMLGLMVVLSAYYLFTDDAGTGDVPADTASSTPGSEITIDHLGTWDPAVAEESIGLNGIADLESSEAPDTASAGSNAAVLEQVMYQSASDQITNMQMDRGIYFSKQLEELAMAMTDESATDEEIAAAASKHDALMDLEQKLIAFEEKLFADYENAAVMYDEKTDHYTVHVSAPALERSEAVTIVSEAMHDLGIGVHQISVQVHKQ